LKIVLRMQWNLSYIIDGEQKVQRCGVQSDNVRSRLLNSVNFRSDQTDPFLNYNYDN